VTRLEKQSPRQREWGPGFVKIIEANGQFLCSSKGNKDVVMPTALILLIALECGADSPMAEARDAAVLELATQATDYSAGMFTKLEALRTLGKLGSDAKAAAPILADKLGRIRRGDVLPLQEAIVVTLGKIGPAATAAIPTITRAAGQDIDLDRAISHSIGLILVSPEAHEISELAKLLHSRDVSQRVRAAKALALKGPRAEAAAPALVLALQDNDADVRRAAVGALRAIQPNQRPTEAIMQVYIQDLEDSDDNVRLLAARALGRMGPAAAAAVPALQKATGDVESDVRRAATEALGKISPQ
jgi:HEAT repeat protein